MAEKKDASTIIKYTQFFIGLAMGLLTLYYSSTKWEAGNRELLFEIKELRKDYVKIDSDIAKLTHITTLHEKAVNKYDIKLDMLEIKINTIEREISEKKKIGLLPQ